MRWSPPCEAGKLARSWLRERLFSVHICISTPRVSAGGSGGRPGLTAKLAPTTINKLHFL